MSKPIETSPMVELDFSQLDIEPSVLSIKEHPFLGYVNLRGASDNIKFMRAVKKVLSVDLPQHANTFVEHGDQTILWLGPNEWLILMPKTSLANVITQLEVSLADIFSAVNDVSGGSTILEVAGKKAQALLLKGCPLDLHHSVFSTGQCAQTVIAKTAMTLWQADDAPIYKLIVRRSFSDYLGLWLLNAAKEYQT